MIITPQKLEQAWNGQPLRMPLILPQRHFHLQPTLVYRYLCQLMPGQVSFFALFFGDDTMDLLVEETNRLA